YYEGQGLVMLEADTLGVPVMACDVSGPHGFLTEHGGTLLENSEEGILKGMRLFAEGKVRTLCLDYEKMNRESAQMVEDMIAEMLDCTEETEIQ
ncbi:MAG TPA: teichoic acid biosynthesis protein TagF, partial [Candidatus Blautia excrementigallinarum]|nr:teichoic acid biosynthesis protein TagF [Candidatus Blautia excrementigallinarum]